MLITFSQIPHLSIFMIDISQSFLQAGELAKQDKLITTVPPYIILPDPNVLPRCAMTNRPIVLESSIRVLNFDEHQCLTADQKRSNFRRCLVTHRPLYGGRDARLRRYLRLAAVLRRGGWRNTRCDVCAFTRHSKLSNGEIKAVSSIIIVHVDDMLIASTAEDLYRLKKTLAQFKKGPMMELPKEKELEYLVVQIQINTRGHIDIHQSR